MRAARLGRELTRWRRAAGLTQAELARRLGTTQSVVSRVESGRCLPSLPFLARVARATGRTRLVLDLAGDRVATREARRRRVRRVLGGYIFNPWERAPTPAEARSLRADGLTRERFEGARAPQAR